MTNLLHLVVALAEDQEARDSFRARPHAAVAEMTSEDVAAAADLARVQVAPELAERLTRVLDTRTADGSATASLLALCDIVEGEDDHGVTDTP